MGPISAGGSQALMRCWSYLASEGGFQLQSPLHSRWVRLVGRVRSRWRGWIASHSGPPPYQCPDVIATMERMNVCSDQYNRASSHTELLFKQRMFLPSDQTQLPSRGSEGEAKGVEEGHTVARRGKPCLKPR